MGHGEGDRLSICIVGTKGVGVGNLVSRFCASSPAVEESQDGEEMEKNVFRRRIVVDGRNVTIVIRCIAAKYGFDKQEEKVDPLRCVRIAVVEH
jgi:hypothetical protein